jgi:hypothetical protein
MSGILSGSTLVTAVPMPWPMSPGSPWLLREHIGRQAIWG